MSHGRSAGGQDHWVSGNVAAASGVLAKLASMEARQALPPEAITAAMASFKGSGVKGGVETAALDANNYLNPLVAALKAQTVMKRT